MDNFLWCQFKNHRNLNHMMPAPVAQALLLSYSTSYCKMNDCCKPQQQLQCSTMIDQFVDQTTIRIAQQQHFFC